jgi:hypothetical protein
MKNPTIKNWSQLRAADTAVAELKAALERHGGLLAGLETIHVGLLPDLPDRVQLIRRGLINLHNTDPGRDAFEALRLGAVLYLLGSTPRGLLQAVYALDEQLVFNKQVPSDWYASGVFRIGQRHFHPRFDSWPGERADIRYLSRLGASHCLISHDWQGSLRSFQGYVTSPIFPNAVPPEEVARNSAGLRQLIENCHDYGLDLALWITELPCQGGPWMPEPVRRAWLDQFSPEVLSDSGTYQGKVLCFSHPKVQAFYRDVLHLFFEEFPEIGTIYLFGMDSGGEGCDPESCPRCRGMSKFEQRDRLIRFLIEQGGKARPGLRVLTTGWHWESKPGEFLERQARLPAQSGVYLAAESDGWQVERQNHAFLRRVRSVCRERGQLFIGYDDFHLGDDATHLWGFDLQDFPLGIGAKLARWHDLEADGVFDHWGAFHEMIPSNSMACREFFLNPLADPVAVCRRLALRQYGPVAGERAFSAWESIEQAHRILSNCATWAPRQWPNWYLQRSKPPLPDTFLEKPGHDAEPLVAKEAVGFTFNGGTAADCLAAVSEGWRLAVPFLGTAVGRLTEAAAAADDEPVGYAFWWNGKAKAPGRREHLVRHKIYVEYLMLLGREIGLHFGLQARFEALGRNAKAYLAESREALAQDRDACLDIVAFIDRLLADYPDSPAQRGWRDDYALKAKRIQGHLDQEPTWT